MKKKKKKSKKKKVKKKKEKKRKRRSWVPSLSWSIGCLSTAKISNNALIKTNILKS